MSVKHGLGILSAVAVLCYPLLVWYGLSFGRIEWLIWLFILAFGVRLLTLHTLIEQKNTTQNLLWMSYALVLCGVVICVLSGILKNYQLLLYYPVAINLILLSLFAFSLKSSMPIIERFARLREPHLPHSAIRYTYRLTQVWCLFFIVNGSIALGTCLYGDMQIWTLYNGLISYIFIGVVMAIEWVVRKNVQRKERICEGK